MAALVASEAGKPIEDDETEEDFGLYYPAWYALATWQDYRRHHLLPESGGLNDQDWQWWQDMRTLNARYHRAAALYGKRDDDALPTPKQAADWTDL